MKRLRWKFNYFIIISFVLTFCICVRNQWQLMEVSIKSKILIKVWNDFSIWFNSIRRQIYASTTKIVDFAPVRTSSYHLAGAYKSKHFLTFYFKSVQTNPTHTHTNTHKLCRHQFQFMSTRTQSVCVFSDCLFISLVLPMQPAIDSIIKRKLCYFKSWKRCRSTL